MTAEEEEFLRRIEDRLLRIDRNLLTNLRWSIDIMATQTEAAAQLATITTTLDKISGETAQLLAAIEALQVAAANVSPELQTAIDTVAQRAQAIDDLVADVPAPAPPPAG